MSSKKVTVLLLVLGLVIYAASAQAALTVTYPGSNSGNNTTGEGLYLTVTNSTSVNGTGTPLPSPHTYAILVGSRAPSDGVDDALRGDLDVDRVNSQLQSWVTDIYTFKYQWNDSNTVATDIGQAASSIAGRIQPGDSFIFYYSGHGTGGSATGVQDFINPVQSGGLQDDVLTSVFSGASFSEVNKFFLIDSCHSEGMWKNDLARTSNPKDYDLQTLSKISFLASSSEDGDAYYDSKKGSYFTNAILPALKPDSTFGSLFASAMAASGTNVTGYTKGEGAGTGSWEAVGLASLDFNFGATLGVQSVPEPASLLMLFAGAAVLVGWRRYRKS